MKPDITLALRLKRFARLGLVCCLASFFAPNVSLAAEPASYTLAVVPQLPPLTTHKAWAPVVDKLVKESGVNIVLKLYEKVAEFEVELLAGTPDLVYMNPYHQVMARPVHGYIPLVRDNAVLLSGIVVVARNGPIKTIKDLDGKTIAFPSPNAYAASLYIRALLTEQFKLRFTPTYVDSHTDVYRQVILGAYMGAGAVNKTLARESDELQSQLSILYETPASAPHPISAHPRVRAQDREKITAAMLRLGADPANTALLQAIQMKQPVAADYQRDYQPLEKLKLEKYVIKR